MANILQNKILRRIALAVGALLAVALLAAGTVFLLSRITPAKQIEKVLSPVEVEQQMELGRQKVTLATEKAHKGETDAAMSLYKEAVVNFKEAGDTASVGAVQLEIEYLEKVKTMSPNTNPTPQAPLTPTYADPTKDEGYGVTATYPDR